MLSIRRLAPYSLITKIEKNKPASNPKLTEIRFKTEQDVYDIEEQKNKMPTSMAAQSQQQDTVLRNRADSLENLSLMTIKPHIDDIHPQHINDQDQYWEPFSPTSDNPIINLQPLASPHQVHKDTLTSDLLETKLFIRRVISFNLFMGIVSILLLFSSMSSIPFQNLFTVVYCYLFYFILESVFRIIGYNRSLEHKKEDIFQASDAICLMMLLVSIELKLLKMSLWPSLLSMCPSTIVILAYFMSGSHEAPPRLLGFILRFVYLIQGTLIALKVDGIIHTDWMIILTIVWICAAVLIIYIIVFTFILILSLSKIAMSHNKDRKLSAIIITHTFGALWQLIYYTLCAIVPVTLYALLQAQNGGQDSRMLTTIAHFDYIVCYILAVLSVVGYKRLASYLAKYRMTKFFTLEEDSSQQISNGK